MFTAFTSLAGVDAGLDFKLIEPFEKGGHSIFSRNNQIPKLTPLVMLPPS
jgi:hypothetical protein